jgi:hypothetical protein
MFGGGWGLEGVGSSQEFDISAPIPEGSSRSRSGSGGNTPRKTQVARSSEVVPRDTVVQKRKPFGSPASPKVRSPKSTAVPFTRSTDAVAETVTDTNGSKGRERGVFHAHNSSDVLFKRAVAASPAAGTGAEHSKKYQKKETTGDDDEDSNGNEEMKRRNGNVDVAEDGKNGDSGEDSPSTENQSNNELISDTKWSDEDFALSVSVRSDDIPLKGCTFQRNGCTANDAVKDNGKENGTKVNGEGEGGVEEKKLEKGVDEEDEGTGEEEEEDGAGLKSLRDDSQTVHKYVSALLLLYSFLHFSALHCNQIHQYLKLSDLIFYFTPLSLLLPVFSFSSFFLSVCLRNLFF